MASRGMRVDIKVDSTVAKMQAKRKAEESERLNHARDARERRECGVLLSRIQTKREHLSMVQARLLKLQEHNVMIKRRIESEEAAVMNGVQSMLQRCSRFVGSKQFLSRAHRIDHAEAVQVAGEADTRQAATLQRLRETLRRRDEEVNQEVVELKGLIQYRERTSRADEERKNQLNQDLVTLARQCEVEQMELGKTIVHAMEINRSTLQERIDGYLGGVLDDQLKVMGADVTVHSLTKEDLLVVIKEMESEVNTRKDAVETLQRAGRTLHDALAWNSADPETGHLFHRLPSWQDDRVGRRFKVAASLRGIAAAADIPQGYSTGTTRPPYPIA